MRMFVAILTVAAIAFAGTAMAADVPQDTLSQMGIQGMQKVSDAEGLEIRGMGNTYDTFNQVLNMYRSDILLSQVNAFDVRASRGRDDVLMGNSVDIRKTKSPGNRPWPAGVVNQANELTSNDSRLLTSQGNSVFARLLGHSAVDPSIQSVVNVDQSNMIRVKAAHKVDVTQSNLLDMRGLIGASVLQSNYFKGSGIGFESAVQINTGVIR